MRRRRRNNNIIRFNKFITYFILTILIVNIGSIENLELYKTGLFITILLTLINETLKNN